MADVLAVQEENDSITLILERWIKLQNSTDISNIILKIDNTFDITFEVDYREC